MLVDDRMANDWVTEFDVVLEDMSTVEGTQDVLRSGAITGFQISEMEMALRHGAKVIEKELSA